MVLIFIIIRLCIFVRKEKGALTIINGQDGLENTLFIVCPLLCYFFYLVDMKDADYSNILIKEQLLCYLLLMVHIKVADYSNILIKEQLLCYFLYGTY
jgi:hypothetical protein